MCRKGLTMLEILIITSIIGTATTVGIPICKELSKSYRHTAHETVTDALTEYAENRNVVPGILS